MSVLNVAIVVTPHFSPFHLSVPSILFGDRISGKKLFDIKMCAEIPGVVVSDSGFSLVADAGFDALPLADIIVVPFWHSVYERPSAILLDSLNSAYHNGAKIVGLCLGAFVLGYAGLLSGKRAATHWEYEKDFQKLFPDASLDINTLYVEDQNILTSAGTAAALDCCLYIIRQHFGSLIANQIARRMIVPPHREGGQAQFIEHPVPQDTADVRINTLLDYLRRNINQPYDIEQLAQFVSMSRRTLTRHFIKATGQTVANWITTERLRRSQILLETSNLPIEQIADHIGFQSAVTFRQQFKSHFNTSPSEWRKTFQGINGLS
ncbi:GlxA family transcriptional regulator [Pragia fontium]|uniref:Transcriptional regulator GlxA family, contains an amidase domain and an AraC-type DNA-binding HTH domain n=2 Tax=Pragia fontium TaxID=82985 RepID=A0AAJ4WDG3_9GAMM|nr:helix-turn-helix domain-containing protein [Pragia fontium]GKX61592.1 AraC family transcriptional regulator [Pragia fontium]SFD42147.1 Transcriptional regulator GlxA family, contains an amidase domain and an AraC-type DNA-binding HTH domain [Pragia fontium DSM 5563 = ATCC 49100]SUB82606.1 Multiple antibiotic resistance protein marA [Pragia fontium]VEJ55507.1 Multiple antibiotic resistance protein marA [Pragia fontium]